MKTGCDIPPPPTWYVTASPDNTRPKNKKGLAVFTKSTVKGSSLFDFFHILFFSLWPVSFGLNAANISCILIMQSSTLTALHRHDPQSSSSSFPPQHQLLNQTADVDNISNDVCVAGLVGDQLLRL